MNFGSVLTAMVTPFSQNNDIDYDQTEILIEYLLDNGTEGLVINGTTGESPTLSIEEKINLFKHVVKVVNQRVPVIAGTSSNDTAASIALTKEAEKAGVDAAMIVAPYYNNPSQRGMYEHFKAIANATSLPVVLYNIPGRSVVTINAETIIKLSKIDNIVSVKEASGDLDLVSQVIEETSDDFSVYSGEDGLTLPMLAIGSDGVISVSSHIIGNEMQRMVKAYRTGNIQDAASIHRRTLPIMRELFKSPSPAPVKAALEINGVNTGGVRLPLLSITADEKKALKIIMDNQKVSAK
ncbi:4-hydroxy-tetrahydrodipicolinate synthase [Virgibacillus natechei]|uniref:4-hydroxy-tetrahydrodipicolinate synthase n=1 Tax=Virgibacillus natechei TaxID=1216297 RepID=A0ABS4IDC2_9BACI|nr:4-hydroxy-tetrahydrodipicolinate synthase [Virgibacillus natechei]MBP1968049.1 4-hydroxy-tetrahydrodipicolinate synthase [Virgibacillus natechei]UZD14670.1 4-hydroxy-tetrahydrodipicolinate synthase [Virgibacillus natechei]